MTIASPLQFCSKEDAHAAISFSLGGALQGFYFSDGIDELEMLVLNIIGVDESKNSFTPNPNIDWGCSILFDTFPFYQEHYQVYSFDRDHKICIFFPDGFTEDEEYDPDYDHGLNFPMVFYSPEEWRAWVVIFLLAKINFYPKNHRKVIEIAKKHFSIEDCLLLLNEKLTGKKPWSFGVEGKFLYKHGDWQKNAHSSLVNLPYIKWLAMAEASWLRYLAATAPLIHSA